MSGDCETRHPGSLPRMSMQNAGSIRPDGTRKSRLVCLECKRIEAQEHRDQVKGARYGVVALNWPAPRLDV